MKEREEEGSGLGTKKERVEERKIRRAKVLRE
jgi:hypothetical protein